MHSLHTFFLNVFSCLAKSVQMCKAFACTLSKKPKKNKALQVCKVCTPKGVGVALHTRPPHPLGPREILHIILPFVGCAICRDRLGDGWRIVDGYQSRIPVCGGCAERNHSNTKQGGNA
jgi:hypothetical protein